MRAITWGLQGPVMSQRCSGTWEACPEAGTHRWQITHVMSLSLSHVPFETKDETDKLEADSLHS